MLTKRSYTTLITATTITSRFLTTPRTRDYLR